MRKITVGGMSRGGGGAKACAKRVAPPALPAEALPHRLSGSSFGSQGYASCEDPYPPPDTPSHTRDDHSDYGSTASGASGSGSGGSGGAAGVAVVDVRGLLGAGVPDAAVLEAWLRALRLGQYAALLVGAGYDVPTAARMTPEDLTAVGVRKPQHRRRLKQELAALALPDHLPDHIPGSLEEWLRLLRLEEYAPALAAQGFRAVSHLTTLAWEDLEDLGIVRLGHQKKILLAIKRVRDILSGKHLAAPRAPQLRPPRGKSLESLEDADRHEAAWRCCDRADLSPSDPPDLTPTNPLGGTLPRHRTQNRTRPVAKVSALPGVRTRALVHAESPPLALPACPSSESLSLSLEGVLPPPPPAPPSPPPRRHASDGSFQSSSSAESDSLPFANERAGTLRAHPARAALPPADVLGDIGDMLATLTDELDAMLEEEKRQGLARL